MRELAASVLLLFSLLLIGVAGYVVALDSNDFANRATRSAGPDIAGLTMRFYAIDLAVLVIGLLGATSAGLWLKSPPAPARPPSPPE